MNKKIFSERMAQMLVLILMATAVSANIVLAGDKGSLGEEKTIDIYDLTTWQDVENITDTIGDNLNNTVTNVTDIQNVWMCNNYTYLFVRVDTNATFANNNFTINLYIEDANHTKAGNDTLLLTNAGIDKNDVNATFLFHCISNGTIATFSRYNWTGTQWAADQQITNATTQGAVNWTENSFVMMIHLNLLSSTGSVNSTNSFKFEIYTAWCLNLTTWYAADYLDYATYTLTGEVIPEFTNLALMLVLVLITGFAIVATKKLKLPR